MGMNKKQEDAAVQAIAAKMTLGSCIFCNKFTAFAGVFIPDNPQKYGAPKDKERLIGYRMCSDCKTTMSYDEIEWKLLQLQKKGLIYH